MRPRPWRILLVDDDVDSRELYGEHLRASGFEVLHAANGVAGVETAIRRKPDIIVMDIEMPVMGGLEAIERLRLDARTRAIPIIVLSGNAAVDHARAQRVGCNTCLVKPCDPTDLEGVAHAILDATQL